MQQRYTCSCFLNVCLIPLSVNTFRAVFELRLLTAICPSIHTIYNTQKVSDKYWWNEWRDRKMMNHVFIISKYLYYSLLLGTSSSTNHHCMSKFYLIFKIQLRYPSMKLGTPFLTSYGNSWVLKALNTFYLVLEWFLCPSENSWWVEFHVGFIRVSPDLFTLVSQSVLGKLYDVYIKFNPNMMTSSIWKTSFVHSSKRQ